MPRYAQRPGVRRLGAVTEGIGADDDVTHEPNTSAAAGGSTHHELWSNCITGEKFWSLPEEPTVPQAPCG